jgi:hypothetical protein
MIKISLLEKNDLDPVGQKCRIQPYSEYILIFTDRDPTLSYGVKVHIFYDEMRPNLP